MTYKYLILCGIFAFLSVIYYKYRLKQLIDKDRKNKVHDNSLTIILSWKPFWVLIALSFGFLILAIVE